MPNVVRRAERRARRSCINTGKQHQIVLRARDDPCQILDILSVEAVKERQLLLAVRGIVERVDIQRQRTGGSSNDWMNCSRTSLATATAHWPSRILHSARASLAGQSVSGHA